MRSYYTTAMFLSLGAASTCDTLREWGDANNFLIGSQFKYDEMNDIDTYAEVHGREMAISVAGNACKPSSVQKTRGEFDFTECLDLAKRAYNNGQKFRGHALVWHNQ